MGDGGVSGGCDWGSQSTRRLRLGMRSNAATAAPPIGEDKKAATDEDARRRRLRRTVGAVGPVWGAISGLGRDFRAMEM
ncbi:hypothetical protein E2562_030868 [Oryza meyeriana var. granulata]|uniref:Uncharacterized protein n=1 Tax=Oryza meyeriana var. granulata TaxID=110450 RepID=A0A6G1F021_9ORYZ|nr:hypothetical protein E2562_030868 [Oryza meyeriana var. granulata]